MSDKPLALCEDILETVPELPEVPETFPVTFPVKFPVTFPTKFLPFASVISSCEYTPVPFESNSIFALVDKEVVLPVAEPFKITPFEFLL